MKKILVLLFASLLIIVSGFAQKVSADKVPAAVGEAFAKKFPYATNVKYEMEGKAYEINFRDKGFEMSANFDAKGKWLETETEVKKADLPKEVTASAANFYPGFTISEAAKTDTPENVSFYDLELKKGKEAWEVRFTPEGDMVKKTPVK